MSDIPEWARDTRTQTAAPDWAADAPPAPQRNYALTEVPEAASANAKKSVDNQIEGLVHLVTNPSEAVQGAWDLTKGLASKAMRFSGLTDLLASAGRGAPEADLARTLERQKAGFREKTADATGEAIKNRYGGWENIKRTAAEDPAGFLLDAATIGSLGAFTPGRAALRTGTGALGVADAAVVRPGVELLSGVSSEAQRLAQRAGEVGGARGAAFVENMRQPNYRGMQDTLREGVRDAKHERNVEYRADMANMRNNWTPGSYGPVGRALIDAADSAMEGGFLKHVDVPPVIQEMGEAIRTHFNTPGMGNDAIAFDALKQRLGATMMAQPEGSTARRAASTIYNALNEEIRRIAPEYAPAMERYAEATRDINEITKSLGAGERATRFSTAGKLLSAMRSDASVVRGARGDALADVARHQPTLPYMLAGATMNPAMPRGLLARGMAAYEAAHAAGGGAGIAKLLAAIPALVAASPRVNGVVRYGLGSATRGARAAGLTQRGAGEVLELMRMGAELENEQK
jgi:hypothetical protein